jgi:hypothetical protein
MHGRRIALCLGLLGLAGCTSLGPATIRGDRDDFAEAITDAAKRETLLNIVKLRYADTPGLVSVSRLVAGYSLNGSANLGSIFFDVLVIYPKPPGTRALSARRGKMPGDADRLGWRPPNRAPPIALFHPAVALNVLRWASRHGRRRQHDAESRPTAVR